MAACEGLWGGPSVTVHEDCLGQCPANGTFLTHFRHVAGDDTGPSVDVAKSRRRQEAWVLQHTATLGCVLVGNTPVTPDDLWRALREGEARGWGSLRS